MSEIVTRAVLRRVTKDNVVGSWCFPGLKWRLLYSYIKYMLSVATATNDYARIE